MPHARKPGKGARGHPPRSRCTVTGRQSRTAGAGISFSASYRPARRPRRHLPDKAWSLPAASGTDRRPRRIMLSRLSFRRSRSFDATPYEFQRRHRLSTRWQELIYHGDKGGLRQAPTNNELIFVSPSKKTYIGKYIFRMSEATILTDRPAPDRLTSIAATSGIRSER